MRLPAIATRRVPSRTPTKKLRPKGAILDSRERCHLARVVTGLTVADSKARMATSQGVPYRIVEAIPH